MRAAAVSSCSGCANATAMSSRFSILVKYSEKHRAVGRAAARSRCAASRLSARCDCAPIEAISISCANRSSETHSSGSCAAVSHCTLYSIGGAGMGAMEG